MNHSLGAINKQTREYVSPKIANKKDEYSCPDCSKDLILCQGEIRVPYFRHKVDTVNPCNYYNKPSESQIHKDAKMLMKMLLDKKTPLLMSRNCTNCKKKEEFEIPEISETSDIQNEYRFEYNGLKIADVAYIDAGEIVCLFEICNTHKTSSENRPEPWFEIDALTLIGIANDTSINSMKIPCIRCEKCEECIENEKKLLHKLRVENYFQNENERKKRNEKRLAYNRYLNRNNPNKVIVPYEYTGNIKQYPEFVNNYIYEYIEKYEKREKKLLFHMPNFYEPYKKALLNIYKYTGVLCLSQYYWNKNIVDTTKINALLKKDNLKNPITMFNHIKELFEKNFCVKCKFEGYCVCDLSNRDLELLNSDKCLICKDIGKVDCFYCKKYLFV